MHNAIPEMPLISDSEVRYVLAGKRRPQPVVRKALIKVASDYARWATPDLSFDTERARLRWYAANVSVKPLRRCAREGCDNAVSTRQRYCSIACRQAGYRASKRAAA